MIVDRGNVHILMHEYMYVCMYACIYVYMYVCARRAHVAIGIGRLAEIMRGQTCIICMYVHIYINVVYTMYIHT